MINRSAADFSGSREGQESGARFRALLEEVSAACSRVAKQVQGRDRAGLLMAAALLRIDLAAMDREGEGVWSGATHPHQPSP